jgi:hypothetical protein
MGSRAVALVLGQLLTDTAIKRKCREVAFVAADIDSDIFRNLADGFALNPSTKVTLYASSRDRVLKVSEWVTVDSRAGQVQGGKGKQGTPLVFPEINSIDASAVDKGFLGHSYYDNPTMLADLFDLFTYDQYPSGKYRRDCNRKYTLLQPPDEPEWNCAVKAGSDQKGPSTSAISGGPAADER